MYEYDEEIIILMNYLSYVLLIVVLWLYWIRNRLDWIVLLNYIRERDFVFSKNI